MGHLVLPHTSNIYHVIWYHKSFLKNDVSHKKWIGYHTCGISISSRRNQILSWSPCVNRATFWWDHARKPSAPIVSQQGKLACFFWGKLQYLQHITLNVFVYFALYDHWVWMYLLAKYNNFLPNIPLGLFHTSGHLALKPVCASNMAANALAVFVTCASADLAP